jgi:hypothetical protein
LVRHKKAKICTGFLGFLGLAGFLGVAGLAGFLGLEGLDSDLLIAGTSFLNNHSNPINPKNPDPSSQA